MHESIFEHEFRWERKRVRLQYTIETTLWGRQLTLLDILGASMTHVEAVPDWRIEAEACDAACRHDAKYM